MSRLWEKTPTEGEKIRCLITGTVDKVIIVIALFHFNEVWGVLTGHGESVAWWENPQVPSWVKAIVWLYCAILIIRPGARGTTPFFHAFREEDG
jgi:hypothetical protein